MQRPWVAIGWLAVWGVFQAFAVVSVLNGTWERPAVFPGGVYEAMVYADVVFIPLYLASALLLYRRHPLGAVVASVASGGIIYAMLYLIALSRLSGAVNLVADGTFLLLSIASVWQVSRLLWRSAAEQ